MPSKGLGWRQRDSDAEKQAGLARVDATRSAMLRAAGHDKPEQLTQVLDKLHKLALSADDENVQYKAARGYAEIRLPKSTPEATPHQHLHLTFTPEIEAIARQVRRVLPNQTALASQYVRTGEKPG